MGLAVGQAAAKPHATCLRIPKIVAVLPRPMLDPQCNGAWEDEAFYKYAVLVAGWGVANSIATILVGAATAAVDQCTSLTRLLQTSALLLMMVSGG